MNGGRLVVGWCTCFGLVAAACLILARPVNELARNIFSHVCHQRPDRCLSFGGEVMPLCARCAGVYVGFGITLAGLLLSKHRSSSRFLSRPLLILVALCFVAMPVQVVMEWLGGSFSNDFRFLVGTFGGAAFAAIMFPVFNYFRALFVSTPPVVGGAHERSRTATRKHSPGATAAGTRHPLGVGGSGCGSLEPHNAEVSAPGARELITIASSALIVWLLCAYVLKQTAVGVVLLTMAALAGLGAMYFVANCTVLLIPLRRLDGQPTVKKLLVPCCILGLVLCEFLLLARLR